MSAIEDVIAERARQDAKWGQQNHRDGTGPGSMPLFSYVRFIRADWPAARLATEFRNRTDSRFWAGSFDGPGTWTDILLEEVFEALAEEDPAKLRAELIQVAAVATQWAEAIDRRSGGETGGSR